jgi:hypothetical protein
MLEGKLVALADGELKVAGLEKSALAGGKTVLVDAGEDLLGRTRDDASLCMQARRYENKRNESKSDKDEVAGGPFCGRRMSSSTLREEKQVQWIGLKSINGGLQLLSRSALSGHRCITQSHIVSGTAICACGMRAHSTGTGSCAS